MKYRALFICLFALFFLSCSKKEVKPVSLESKTATEAFTLAETIREAFVNKDLAVLKDNTTDEGYKAVLSDSRPFDSVSLTFTPRWVEIENNQVMLNISWQSDWVISGKNLQDRGMAVFVLEGKPLKVGKILRANPFSPPRT